LKLGTFQTNLDSACVMSGLEDRFRISLPNTLALAKLANEMELEAIVARAEEWLAIVRRLWTEDEEFDFDGSFYQIRKGYLEPKPIQRPLPPIMNAGASERGRHFAVKNCDLVFTLIRTHDYDINAAHVAAYRKLAREEYGRSVKVWTHACVIQGETEK
jgi:alkanesulfonate monooxygenase SsuD/methylene tetrahydromethanopterin reductase-like flavin-dependent oxidoreductase (luciferase family)